MSIFIPTTIGSPAGSGDPTAPTPYTFEELYTRALDLGRVSNSAVGAIDFVKDRINELYQFICALVPEAPWMRTTARLLVPASKSGSTAHWTYGLNQVKIDGWTYSSADAAQYVGGRIFNPAGTGFYFVQGHIGFTSGSHAGTALTLDMDTIYPTSSPSYTGSYELFVDVFDTPADCVEVLAITPPDNRPDLQRGNQLNLQDLYATGRVAGSPNTYSIMWHSDGKEKIVLHDAPSEAGVYTLTYQRSVTPLSGTSDEPILPNDFRIMLAYGAAAFAAAILREDTQLANYLTGVFNGYKSKLEGKFGKEIRGPQFSLNTNLRPYGAKARLGGRVDANDAWDRR